MEGGVTQKLDESFIDLFIEKCKNAQALREKLFGDDEETKNLSFGDFLLVMLDKVRTNLKAYGNDEEKEYAKKVDDLHERMKTNPIFFAK